MPPETHIAPSLRGTGEGATRRPALLAAMVQSMVVACIRAGLDPVNLLAKTGLTFEELEHPHTHVPHEKVLSFAREIHSAQPGIELGLHMGGHMSPAHMEALGFALSHAPTLGVAFHDLTRLQQFMNGGLVLWNMLPRADRCVVTLTPGADLTGLEFLLEAPFAMFITIARKLCGQRITPLSVSFRHAARGDGRVHEDLFGVAAQFNAPLYELVLDASALELPVLHADIDAHDALIRHVEARVEQMARTQSFEETVRQHLVRTLREGPPRKDIVARALGSSSRTLLRRLAEEGTTFDEILNRTRRGLAVEYMADPTMDTAHVARALGYSGPSPFFRAFSRWFGCTPAEYRMNLQDPR